jgi:hypothetical protein
MKAKLLLVGLILTMSLLVTPLVRAPNGIPGDIDEDGDVDITDIILAGSQYMLPLDHPDYNSTIVGRADFVAPFGIVTLLDMVTIAYHYTG